MVSRITTVRLKKHNEYVKMFGKCIHVRCVVRGNVVLILRYCASSPNKFF
jgi:hypothetical protein